MELRRKGVIGATLTKDLRKSSARLDWMPRDRLRERVRFFRIWMNCMTRWAIRHPVQRGANKRSQAVNLPELLQTKYQFSNMRQPTGLKLLSFARLRPLQLSDLHE